jgi:hypothetical protein
MMTSLLVAFAGITRPVTAMALALPVAAIVWPRLRSARGWRDVAVSGAAGLIICAVVPVWNHAVLGSWTTVPYAEYSARTFPFDMPTWKTNWAPPPRDIPPDFVALADVQRELYRERSVTRVPAVVVERIDAFGSAALPAGVAWLRFLAPLGLVLAGGAGWVALASALLLVLAHVSMPHPPEWTIYYLDVFPVVAFGAVLAVAHAVAWLARRRAEVAATVTHAGPRVAAGAAGVLLAGAAVWWRPPSVDSKGWMRDEMYFRAGLCALPAGPKIVFVHRRRDASPHHSLVDNDPRWARSDTWIVRDWDPERNRALIAAAPDRALYYYDEHAGWLARMNRDGTPTHEGVVNVLRTDLQTGRSLVCHAA